MQNGSDSNCLTGRCAHKAGTGSCVQPHAALNAQPWFGDFHGAAAAPQEHVAPVCAVSKVFQRLAEYQKWNILDRSTHPLSASSREETVAPSPPRTLPGVCPWG